MPLARDTLIEIMEDGMIVLDEQDRILDINAAAKRLLKVTDQPLIGDSIYRLPLPESAWETINLQNVAAKTFKCNTFLKKARARMGVLGNVKKKLIIVIVPSEGLNLNCWLE